MNSTKKPLLSVASKPSMVRKSFGIPNNVAQRLEDYAEFLGSVEGKSVKPADIIGTLSEKLEKDSLFTKWRSEKAVATATPAKSAAK